MHVLGHRGKVKVTGLSRSNITVKDSPIYKLSESQTDKISMPLII